MKILSRGAPPTGMASEWWIGRQTMCANCDTLYVIESTKDLYTKPKPFTDSVSALCPVCPEDFDTADRLSIIPRR